MPVLFLFESSWLCILELGFFFFFLVQKQGLEAFPVQGPEGEGEAALARPVQAQPGVGVQGLGQGTPTPAWLCRHHSPALWSRREAEGGAAEGRDGGIHRATRVPAQPSLWGWGEPGARRHPGRGLFLQIPHETRILRIPRVAFLRVPSGSGAELCPPGHLLSWAGVPVRRSRD